MKLFTLAYNQPTWRGGKVVPGITYYVSEKPGDGGIDWGYTTDPKQALPLSEWWRRRFFALHGTKAIANEVQP